MIRDGRDGGRPDSDAMLRKPSARNRERNASLTLIRGESLSPLYMEQNKNKDTPSQREATSMLKRMFLTGVVEFMAFGLLAGAVGAWAVALTPIR